RRGKLRAGWTVCRSLHVPPPERSLRHHRVVLPGPPIRSCLPRSRRSRARTPALGLDIDSRHVTHVGVAPFAGFVGPAELERAAARGVDDGRLRCVVPCGAIDLARLVADDRDDARVRSDERVRELTQRPRIAILTVVPDAPGGEASNLVERVLLP